MHSLGDYSRIDSIDSAAWLKRLGKKNDIGVLSTKSVPQGLKLVDSVDLNAKAKALAYLKPGSFRSL